MSEINITLGVASERSTAISNHRATFTSNVSLVSGQSSPAITNINDLLSDIRLLMENYSEFFVRGADEIIKIDNALHSVDRNSSTS